MTKKTDTITIRLTAEQRAKLERLARRKALSLSKLIRLLVDQASG